MKVAFFLFTLLLFFPKVILCECNELSTLKNPYFKNFKKDKICWKPWNKKNFNLAKKRNKLIYLQVIKTGCEQCLKQTKEINKDEDIVNLLNKNFINILVDHSTEPDIANTYKNLILKSNERFTFPISIFLTSDKKVFFKVKSLEKEKFNFLVTKLIRLYKENPKSVIDSANYIHKLFRKKTNNFAINFNEQLIRKAVLENIRNLKEISYVDLLSITVIQKVNFLLDYYYFKVKQEELDKDFKGFESKIILRVIESQLKKLAYSKYYDHLEGGFFTKTSFSKSLVLNAELSMLYAKLFKITNHTLYENVSREILDYTLSYFLDKRGGFYNLVFPYDEKLNEDYHLFSLKTLANTISGIELDTIKKYFNLEKVNTSYKLSLKKDKSWDIKYNLNFFKIIQKLITYRRDKALPFRDSKKILSSNARMIEALSIGYQTFGEARYLLTAKNALNFSYVTFFRDNKLSRVSIDKRVYGDAYLDDFIAFVSAYLNLFKSTSDLKWFRFAQKFQNVQNEIYWDNREFGYFYSKRETLPIFVKLFTSIDFIASNSFALDNLYSLYNLSNNKNYLNQANKLVYYFQSEMGYKLADRPKFLSTVYRNSRKIKKIVIVEGINEVAFNTFKEILFQGFYPDLTMFSVSAFSKKEDLRNINSIFNITRGLLAKDGLSSAYFCTESAGKFTCGDPIQSVEKLVKALNR